MGGSDVSERYMCWLQNNFKLDRGNSTREHLSVETYKEITGFNDVKEVGSNIELQTNSYSVPSLYIKSLQVSGK